MLIINRKIMYLFSERMTVLVQCRIGLKHHTRNEQLNRIEPLFHRR
jgi:hypothetical protein